MYGVFSRGFQFVHVVVRKDSGKTKERKKKKTCYDGDVY